MNKIASIYYLQEQGIPTLEIYNLLNPENPEKELSGIFKPLPHGWVVRCGDMPDYNAPPERALPWGVASTYEELIREVRRIGKEAGYKRLVFVHPQRNMIKAGNFMRCGGDIIIEACSGGYSALARLAAGRDNPQQRLVFRLLSKTVEEGEKILTPNDLLQIIETERKIALPNMTGVIVSEFSINEIGRIDVHDVRN